MAGRGPGRRWITTEINHALILRLASEFQGFCRDLHEESIEAFIGSGLPVPDPINSVVRASLETGRKIDSGNATWANIVTDFQRFGLSLKAELQQSRPGRYSGWVTVMDRLNKARNAIAHDDRVKLAECHERQPLTLQTFRRWRSTLNEVVRSLDRLVGAYLKHLTGTNPW
ncbi:hypothetical protein [Granulicoccus sp. GXG6511]|uniref:hypothetical protein n=1 Tax=Granulicoccus sp. GXG6511 TaxID=3381351 RepID=UPI003D7D8217